MHLSDLILCVPELAPGLVCSCPDCCSSVHLCCRFGAAGHLCCHCAAVDRCVPRDWCGNAWVRPLERRPKQQQPGSWRLVSVQSRLASQCPLWADQPQSGFPENQCPRCGAVKNKRALNILTGSLANFLVLELQRTSLLSTQEKNCHTISPQVLPKKRTGNFWTHGKASTFSCTAFMQEVPRFSCTLSRDTVQDVIRSANFRSKIKVGKPFSPANDVSPRLGGPRSL